MNEVVITAAVRTAVGKFGGSIAKISAADLGAHVIKALPDAFGCAASANFRSHHGSGAGPAGVGQNPARQALIHAGLAGWGAGYDRRQGVRQRIEGDASGRGRRSSAAMRISSLPAGQEKHECRAARASGIPRRIPHG